MEEIAEELTVYLREKLMPYWYDTSVDSRNGGYILWDRLDCLPDAGDSWQRRLLSSFSSRFHLSPSEEGEKQLVSQSRLVFVFSLAHRLGYSDAKRNYLKAAEIGYFFLIKYMLDKRHGGFFWKTDVQGRVLESCKSLYGQAFALFALVEYYRASGLSGPLEQAVLLYKKVQEEFHDRINSGWIEHGKDDFTPLRSFSKRSLLYPRSMPGVLGLKSGNTHMHWMEALVELYDMTRDGAIGVSLKEALDINKSYFFPLEAGKYCEYRRPDWGDIRVDGQDGISYGHYIEFAWLMIHVQRVLRVPADWDHFHRILAHALKYGFDHERGGFYARGFDEQPAVDRGKVWWVQAEALAGLCEALHHEIREDYNKALELLLDWIFKHQIFSEDGVWIWSTDESGKPANFTKAGSWKAAYHEVRAATKFIQFFSLPRDAAE